MSLVGVDRTTPGADLPARVGRSYRRRSVEWDGARGRLPGSYTPGTIDFPPRALVRVRPPHGLTSANMYESDDDGRTADDYPTESSPSTGTFETAEVMDAPDAHTASEYHEPPAHLEVIETMLRDSSTLEVAL